MELRLDGQPFEVAKDRNSEDRLSLTYRSSERGDPSGLHVAEWKVDGPDLTSFEQILPGATSGYLGRDYGINTDGRFEGTDTLGPLITTVTLSTYDNAYDGLKFGTSTAKLGSTFRFGDAPAVTNGVGATIYPPYVYVARGHHPAKVDGTDMTLKRTGLTLKDEATSVVRTVSQSTVNPDEVSIGMNGAPYVVLSEAANHPNTDTWAENDQQSIQRALGIAPDRIVGMQGQAIQGNILTGSTTMLAPNWQTVATIRNKDVQFNSFALDGNLWVVGSSNGPYMLDSDSAEFFPVIDEIDNDDSNCLQMTTWFPIGVVIPLRDGLRQQKNRRGESFGPERFDWNTSPVQGHTHGIAGSTRWLYTTMHNDIDNSLWLLAWGDFHPGDPVRHQHLLAPHVIARLSSTGQDSKYLKYIGRMNGLRSRETLIGDIAGNMFYMSIGIGGREIEDTSYAYAASGTTYFTELRRQAGMIKDIEYFEFATDDCTVTEKMTVGVSMDGNTAITLTGSLKEVDGSSANGVVDTTGLHRIHAIEDDGKPRDDCTGYRFKPQMGYVRGATTTNAPKLMGTLRVHYRVRSKQTRVMQTTFNLAQGRGTADERRDMLLNLWTGRPFKVEQGRETFWAAIDEVQITGDFATVTLTEWFSPYPDRPE